MKKQKARGGDGVVACTLHGEMVHEGHAQLNSELPSHSAGALSTEPITKGSLSFSRNVG